MAKQQQVKEGKQEQQSQPKPSERLSEGAAVPAIVEATLARTGMRGEITQVRAKILQGKNRGKSIRRNVRGPVKKRDILMLRETEIEARRVTRKINKGSQE